MVCSLVVLLLSCGGSLCVAQASRGREGLPAARQPGERRAGEELFRWRRGGRDAG